MSIWDTIATAAPPGSGGVYMKRGDYLVTVTKALHKKSKGRNKGHDLVVVETRVDEVLVEFEAIRDQDGKVLPGEDASNQEGETPSWVRNLTKHPDMAPGDVRAFVAACLDVEIEDLTAAEIQAALDGDGSFLAGTELHVHAWAKPLKDNPDKFFTVVQWSNGERWQAEQE